VDRLEAESTPDYFPFGTAVHAAHKAACEALKEGLEPDETIVLKAFEETWEVLGQNPLLTYSKKHTWDTLLELGIKMTQTLLKEMPRELVLAIDDEFTVPLVTEDGEILEKPLNGIFDLVVETDKGICVVDLKTAAKKYQQSDVDKDLQGTSYVYAVRQLLEHPGIVTFRFDLITKTKTPAFVSYDTQREEKDLNRLVTLFSRAEKAITDGTFLPRRSWRCKTCGHQAACAEWTPNDIESKALFCGVV
jgi:CRISPR/Cas system-associated exonuclease Cas4 (RecB family)